MQEQLEDEKLVTKNRKMGFTLWNRSVPDRTQPCVFQVFSVMLAGQPAPPVCQLRVPDAGLHRDSPGALKRLLNRDPLQMKARSVGRG